ncbi:MAG TPA: response regulator transcription factor [Planctomycetaceae bacterium]|nr:response regulator transcription factor [Planctomycetaceae bacterium]
MSPPNRYRQPSLSEPGASGLPCAAFETTTAACEGERGRETIELARRETVVIEKSVIRVLLVDDHPVVRTGLRVGLERFGGIRVEGEAGDGSTAVDLARSLQPDVALLDVVMPAPDGFETAAAVLAVSSATRIALMSGAFSTRCLERGLGIGVRGFFLKTEPAQRFAAFVHEIHTGAFCCSQALHDILVPGPNGYGLAAANGQLSSLTPRERSMLLELAKGSSLKQVAITIGISYKSADHVKQSLMNKLNLHDRVELARFAMREGLIS